MASNRNRPKLEIREWSFTWDPDKAEENFRKHGVSFLEAASSFLDPYGISGPDRRKPPNEKLVAYSNQEHLLLTVYVGVEGDVIRIISAWRATRAEREKYHRQHRLLPPAHEQSARDGGQMLEVERYRWRRNPYAASLQVTGIRILAEAMPRNARSFQDWKARRTRPRR